MGDGQPESRFRLQILPRQLQSPSASQFIRLQNPPNPVGTKSSQVPLPIKDSQQQPQQQQLVQQVRPPQQIQQLRQQQPRQVEQQQLQSQQIQQQHPVQQLQLSQKQQPKQMVQIVYSSQQHPQSQPAGSPQIIQVIRPAAGVRQQVVRLASGQLARITLGVQQQQLQSQQIKIVPTGQVVSNALELQRPAVVVSTQQQQKISLVSTGQHQSALPSHQMLILKSPPTAAVVSSSPLVQHEKPSLAHPQRQWPQQKGQPAITLQPPSATGAPSRPAFNQPVSAGSFQPSSGVQLSAASSFPRSAVIQAIPSRAAGRQQQHVPSSQNATNQSVARMAGPQVQVVRTLTAAGHHYVIRSSAPQSTQVSHSSGAVASPAVRQVFLSRLDPVAGPPEITADAPAQYSAASSEAAQLTGVVRTASSQPHVSPTFTGRLDSVSLATMEGGQPAVQPHLSSPAGSQSQAVRLVEDHSASQRPLLSPASGLSQAVRQIEGQNLPGVVGSKADSVMTATAVHLGPRIIQAIHVFPSPAASVQRQQPPAAVLGRHDAPVNWVTEPGPSGSAPHKKVVIYSSPPSLGASSNSALPIVTLSGSTAGSGAVHQVGTGGPITVTAPVARSINARGIMPCTNIDPPPTSPVTRRQGHSETGAGALMRTSPIKLEGFRFVTPDGEVLSPDSLQLLTSDGTSLMQPEDVRALLSPSSINGILSIDPLKASQVSSASGGHGNIGVPSVVVESASAMELPQQQLRPTTTSDPPYSGSQQQQLQLIPVSIIRQKDVPVSDQFSSPAAQHLLGPDNVVISTPSAAAPTSKQQSSASFSPEKLPKETASCGQYFIAKSAAKSAKRSWKKATYKDKIEQINGAASSSNTHAQHQVVVTRNITAGRVPVSAAMPSYPIAPPPPPPDIVFPREPLLPSEIQGFVSGLGYVAGALPAFSSAPSVPPALVSELPPPPPLKPHKSKSRSRGKESNKARIQKMEAALNLHHLVASVETAAKRKGEVMEDTELEDEFLSMLEEECGTGSCSRQSAEFSHRYYTSRKHKKRFIDLALADSESEPQEEFADDFLAKLLKKHVKQKRQRLGLLSGEEKSLKQRKGKSRSKSTKADKMSPYDLKNLKRHRLWTFIIKKEVAKGMKARSYNMKEKMAGSKRLATACMRALRQRAMISQKLMKETVWRAKRLTREMQTFWRKSEREEKQQRRVKDRQAQEQRRLDIELLEARRQQRKLNFLITQTELYAHFMSRKMGSSSDGSAATSQTVILERLNSDVTEERLKQLDDYDEAAVKQEALCTATLAAQRQEAHKLAYERQVRASGAGGGSLRMSEAAETAGHRPQPTLFQGQLKTYQLKGMNWLCSLYDQGINGILADEMGLGKTVQALAFLAHVAESYGVWGPFLVVTPASTLHNWQQELARFLPAFTTVPYWGSPQERKVLRSFWNQENLHTKEASFHLVITSYQIVITDFKYLNRVNWQYLVLDEAQAIKSASSQRWKLLLEFKCRGRLLLSGTPIQNTMAELWSLLHFVMPALFDSHQEFKEWFSKDIEGHAEGSRARVDEKQMSRLHLILKPFMLRRIKKDVEHELTEKLEVLVYCPLTIRQRLLYQGLRQNIRMEELLAGLGLGSGNSSVTPGGVSSLMNLVMQFRKVCNHPELFERREPRSPLFFQLPPLLLPQLLTLDLPRVPLNERKVSVFRSDRVSRRTSAPIRSAEYLEAGNGTGFDFLRIVGMSPGELESGVYSLYERWLLLARRLAHNILKSYSWTKDEEDSCSAADQLLLLPPQLPEGFVFTSHTSTFIAHNDVTICSMPETVSHRLIRSKHLANQEAGSLNLIAELPYRPRAPIIRRCVASPCPPFLLSLLPRVAAAPPAAYVSSRVAEYRRTDHERIWVGPEVQATALELVVHGVPAGAAPPPCWYSPPERCGGLALSTPPQGWSNILIPDRHALITDAGKLFVLDGLLRRLKEEGHRVLIYSQMTKMIDLLEEFMSHRQHSFMRLDGSSKIHERRDMVADFQNRQDIFVFLLSTRAGGLGINLTAADTVIFYDSDWNPTVDQQAMDRAHRLGQTRQVTVYRLICKGTIEERILQRAREKSEIHRMVIQGGSFKGRSGDLKPKEVVSLLLDDEEIEQRVREKAAEAEKERRVDATPPTAATSKRKLPRSLSDLSATGGKRKMSLVPAGKPSEIYDEGGVSSGPITSTPVKSNGKVGRPRSARTSWPAPGRKLSAGTDVTGTLAKSPIKPEFAVERTET